MNSKRRSIKPSLSRRGVRLVALLGTAAVAALTTMPVAATPSSCMGTDISPWLSVLGLTADQKLVRFQACNTRQLKVIGSVSGLQSRDSALVGIDFRVQDGKLYGVGNGGGIYTINTKTARARWMSRLSTSLYGDSFGVDFNPAADRLRIISDTGQNLAHNLNDGTTAKNTDLTYPPTPTTPATPGIGLTGAAYTNNDLNTNTGTTLFDIDTSLNQVVIQSPPGAGSLVATGKLTVDPDTAVGFDIYTKPQGGWTSNDGFASLVVNGVSSFYRVNLLTGKAVRMGNFHAAMIDIAIPLNQ